jgi:hypothetical protein
MNIFFYSLATIFSAFFGVAYMASFIRMTGTNGFLKYFTASLLRVALGVIFVIMLLRLPPLVGILMVILCIGSAGITLRFIRPA